MTRMFLFSGLFSFGGSIGGFLVSTGLNGGIDDGELLVDRVAPFIIWRKLRGFPLR